MLTATASPTARASPSRRSPRRAAGGEPGRGGDAREREREVAALLAGQADAARSSSGSLRCSASRTPRPARGDVLGHPEALRGARGQPAADRDPRRRALGRGDACSTCSSISARGHVASPFLLVCTTRPELLERRASLVEPARACEHAAAPAPRRAGGRRAHGLAARRRATRGCTARADPRHVGGQSAVRAGARAHAHRRRTDRSQQRQLGGDGGTARARDAADDPGTPGRAPRSAGARRARRRAARSDRRAEFSSAARGRALPRFRPRPQQQPPRARAQGGHRACRRAPGSGDTFRFTHILVRDAAYAGLAKRTRAELHERFARWLEQSPQAGAGEPEEIVGFHLEQAAAFRRELGDASDADRIGADASAHLAAAGRRALAAGDLPAAANLLGRAGDNLRPAIRSAWRSACRRLLRCSRPGSSQRRTRNSRRSCGTATSAEMLAAATAWRGSFDAHNGIVPMSECEETAAAWLDGERARGRPRWAGLGARHSRQDEVLDRRSRQTRMRIWQRAADEAALAGDLREEAESLVWLLICAMYGPTPVTAALERCDAIARRRGSLAQGRQRGRDRARRARGDAGRVRAGPGARRPRARSSSTSLD